MRDKGKLMKIVTGFEPDLEPYSDLVDAILAAGFGDVGEMLERFIQVSKEKDKRIAALEKIAGIGPEQELSEGKDGA